MTKLKTNIKKMVNLTNRFKELEIIHGQLRDIVNKYYYCDITEIGRLLDDIVDKTRKAADMVDDEIIKVETELGF